MSDREVDEILQSMKKDKDHSEYLEYKGMTEYTKSWSLHLWLKSQMCLPIMQENTFLLGG